MVKKEQNYMYIKKKNKTIKVPFEALESATPILEAKISTLVIKL